MCNTLVNWGPFNPLATNGEYTRHFICFHQKFKKFTKNNFSQKKKKKNGEKLFLGGNKITKGKKTVARGLT